MIDLDERVTGQYKLLYDATENRILYIGKKATEQFWDDQWSGLKQSVHAAPPKNRYISFITSKYLPVESKVLEGGCGLGDKVFSLTKRGYQTYGVDFAAETVESVKEIWPHLNVEKGDVRDLRFEDNFFDGYWSFGVIEHFLDGYESIKLEMKRVIRPGGYLFLTFPMMNIYRTKDCALGRLTLFKNSSEIEENFYQYALDPQRVIKDFESEGFVLQKQSGLSVMMVLSERFKLANKIKKLQERLPFGLNTKINVSLDMVFGKWFGHSALLIFQKKPNH